MSLVLRALLCVLIALTSIGCGDDEENNGNFFPNLNNAETDGGNATTNSNNGGDAGDAGTETDMGDSVGACEVTVDLGVIGDTAMADAEFDPTNATGPTSCADDLAEGETDGTAIVQFELDVPRRIDVTLDGIPLFNNDEPVIPPQPSWEVRSAPCDTGTVELCSVERQDEFELPAGQYFMVISGRLDSGGFRLEMNTEELVCMPGESACVDDNIERCVRGTAIEAFPCFDACSNDAACTGDTCADVVGVTIDVNGAPYTIEGHRRAQSNQWSALGREGCGLIAGEDAPDTTGVELFVRIDGLTMGQELRIDAERSGGNYAFFILPDCAANSCLHAGDFNSESENVTSWVARQDGPVILVVEALGSGEREIVVDLTVVE